MFLCTVVHLAAALEVTDLFISRVVRLKLRDFSTLRETALSAARSFDLNSSIAEKLESRVWRQSLEWYSEPPAVRGYSEGALITGILCMQGSLTIELMDPRGHNPPFGHAYKFRLEPGDLLLFWAGQPFSIPLASAEIVRIELGFFRLTNSTRSRLADVDPLAFLSATVYT